MHKMQPQYLLCFTVFEACGKCGGRGCGACGLVGGKNALKVLSVKEEYEIQQRVLKKMKVLSAREEYEIQQQSSEEDEA